MTAEQLLWSVVGLIIIAVVFYDLFQTVVLPRPAVGKMQLARKVVRPMWLVWRWVSQRTSRIERSESRLAAFAPVALLTMFLIWAAALVVGFMGLLLDGLAGQIRPVPQDLITTMYISASTLVPLAYGDFVPEGGAARLVIFAESATGVAIAALAITLLFSLYESFRAREEMVVSLDAMAGAPPTAVQLLETAASTMRPSLGETFDEWRRWSAMVLESHLAYPLLIYFRSSHDNEAWINSFGAVMDAAILTISTIDDGSEGSAHLMFTVGNHLVEDMSWVFNIKSSDDPIVERAEYEVAVQRLMKAGYRIKDVEAGWKKFAELRARYATGPSIRWRCGSRSRPRSGLGDRTYLPHRVKRSPRPAAAPRPPPANLGPS